MNRIKSLAAIATLMILFGAAVGCDATKRASPLVTEYDEADAHASLDFWHGLAEELVTTNNDAMHGMLELANGTDPFTRYDDRVNWLVEAGYLDKGFEGEPDEAVSRGTVAQVVARVLNIRGGVSMHLIGAHPRYATRELVYLEIMKPGTEQQSLSGIQFVGTISRAQSYAQEKGL